MLGIHDWYRKKNVIKNESCYDRKLEFKRRTIEKNGKGIQWLGGSIKSFIRRKDENRLKT